MEGKLKIVILLLGIFLAISFSIVFVIQNSKLVLLREYNSTKQSLLQENQGLIEQLNGALQENRDLQDRLENIQRDLESISEERVMIQNRYELVNKEREDLLERLESYAQLRKGQEFLENENKELKDELETLKKHKLTLEADLSKLRQDNEKLKQKIERAKYTLKEELFENQYAKLQGPKLTQRTKGWSVDLPPIVVSPQASSGNNASLPKEGSILNVSREYNFIVIDLGRHMGVKEGMVFEVFRQDKILGKVKTIQLRDEIAACDIIQADIPFRQGDIVRY